MTKEEFMEKYGDELFEVTNKFIKEKQLECDSCGSPAPLQINMYLRRDGKWLIEDEQGYSSHTVDLTGWKRLRIDTKDGNQGQMAREVHSFCQECSKEFEEELQGFIVSKRSSIPEDDEAEEKPVQNTKQVCETIPDGILITPFSGCLVRGKPYLIVDVAVGNTLHVGFFIGKQGRGLVEFNSICQCNRKIVVKPGPEAVLGVYCRHMPRHLHEADCPVV